MTDTAERPESRYNIIDVTPAENGRYTVKLIRDGKQVANVRVVSTPSASGYFNDEPTPPRSGWFRSKVARAR